MARCIKLSEPVYNRVTALMGPKESYSQTIERILIMFDKLGELREIIEGETRRDNAKNQLR